MIDPDAQFFTDHPDRHARIRLPLKEIGINKQRATQVIDEGEMEFHQLGPHAKDRRRMLVWRMPRGHPLYDDKKVVVLKIPMLLFSDETVEDRDDILLPMIDEIMVNAAKSGGPLKGSRV